MMGRNGAETIVDAGMNGDEGYQRRGMLRLAGAHRCVACCVLIAVSLAGCGSDYPSLRTVPAASRPSLPIETRRQIVRDLIDERDQSRRQTALVRHRSGLSAEQLPASADDDVLAEDIIPDAPKGADDAFRLTSDEEDSPDGVYRQNTQIEDGGLDDFIKELQRETSPEIPPPPAPADADPANEDKTSFFLPGQDGLLDHGTPGEQPILLAAFAPAITQSGTLPADVGIRLAAAEESGFFCSWFGWTVAWSSMCVDEIETSSPEDKADGDVAAGVDDELRRLQEQQRAENPTSSPASPAEEVGRERAERRLSGQQSSEAIEGLGGDMLERGRDMLAPVTSSLDKLRNFMRARQSATTSAPSQGRPGNPGRSGRYTQSEDSAVDRPPIPRDRPELRQDLTIVDEGEQFAFYRTPTPAFKPTRDQPVILPPANRPRPAPRRSDPPDDPPSVSEADPNDPIVEEQIETEGDEPTVTLEQLERFAVALAEPLPAEQNGVANDQPFADAALSPGAAPPAAASSQEMQETPAMTKAPPAEATPADAARLSADPAELESSGDGEAGGSQPFLIVFEPGTPGLPEAVTPALAALLADAKAHDQKIYIIGEAATNHLARRRANEVGQALVQQGATARILEYDYRADAGVDQVRLVLKPANPDS